MIFIVGDKPSKKNKNPKIPFVGTQSYKRLLEWIFKMDINITNVVLCNIENIESDGEVNLSNFYSSIESCDHVIALGKNAQKYLRDIRVPYYPLPHPSGLNRQNNNIKLIDNELKKCKKWLNN